MSVNFFWDTRPTETCRTTHVPTNTPISSAHSLLRQSIIYYFSDSVNNDHLVEQNVWFKLLWRALDLLFTKSQNLLEFGAFKEAISAA
jgi:hypothetical protein